MTKDRPKTHKKKKSSKDTMRTQSEHRSTFSVKFSTCYLLQYARVNENKGENLITYNRGTYTPKMFYESQQEETIKKKLQNHMTN